MLASKLLYPDALILINPGISLKDLGNNYRPLPLTGLPSLIANIP